MIEADPKDTEECYVLEFLTDSTVFIKSSTNAIFGEYVANHEDKAISMNYSTKTEIDEIGNGGLYVETLPLVQSFSLQNSELKLYYNDSKNYLLFKNIENIKTPTPEILCTTTFPELGEFHYIDTFNIESVGYMDNGRKYNGKDHIIMIVYNKQRDVFSMKMYDKRNHWICHGDICNFPDFAKDWEIPPEGKPIYCKGTYYVAGYNTGGTRELGGHFMITEIK